MLLHVDGRKYKIKPTRLEIGGIKSRFMNAATVKDLSVKQIADALTDGKTIEPGVCPFSEKSRKKGKGPAKRISPGRRSFLTTLTTKSKTFRLKRRNTSYRF